MSSRVHLFLIAALLLLTASGCAVAISPYQPLPTVAPRNGQVVTLEELRLGSDSFISVLNPASVSINPEIAMLLDSISEQNLIGYVQHLESFGTRNTFSATDRDDFGIGAAGRWLYEEFERVGNGRLLVNFQDYQLIFEGRVTTQRNVVALLPGTERDAGVLVLMANYDTRADDWLDGESLAPGADDNASGVAAMLEIARLMSAMNWERTIIFAALTAEEQGTFGSRHFVKETFLNGVNVDAAINNDMIGGRAGIPEAVRVYSIGPNDSGPRRLARYIDHVGRQYLPGFPVQMMDGLDREGRWGDHREFVKAGIPAVRIIESEEDFAIQDTIFDTWSRIDYTYLRQVTQLNLATLASLAASPPSPTEINVRPAQEPGSYRVSWRQHARAVGYAIIFRPVADMSLASSTTTYVGATEAGEVTVAGLDPAQGYAVSVAPMSNRGTMGLFTPEVIVGP